MYNNQTTALDDDGDIQAKKDLLQKEIIDRGRYEYGKAEGG